MQQATEFWRLPVVKRRVGLSKSEIYRRVERGDFPKPRRYPGSRLVYWRSDDVAQWQDRAMGV